MTTTVLTLSIRPKGKSKGLHFYLNIKPDIYSDMKLNEKSHFEIVRSESHYTIRFMDKKNWRSRKIISNSKDGGRVTVPQEFLGFNYVEPLSQKVRAEYDESTITFELNVDSLQKPVMETTVTRKLETIEDKIAAGFTSNSSWGIKVTTEVEVSIKKKTDQYFRKKLEMLDEFNNS